MSQEITSVYETIRKESLFGGKICYSLIRSWSQEYSCEVFGVECEISINGNRETEVVPDISAARSRAEEFFRLAVDNFVFPSTLRECAANFVAA